MDLESEEQMQLAFWAGERFPEKDLGSLGFPLQEWAGLVQGQWDTR